VVALVSVVALAVVVHLHHGRRGDAIREAQKSFAAAFMHNRISISFTTANLVTNN
jgi:hypothetical protein